MLGGGQVRRQSVMSTVGGSPCARLEKRKLFSLQNQALACDDSNVGIFAMSPDTSHTSQEEEPPSLVQDASHDLSTASESSSKAPSIVLSLVDSVAVTQDDEAPFELHLRLPGDEDTGRFSFMSGSSFTDDPGMLAKEDTNTGKFSIASGTSCQFGDDRMGLAREGNLNRRSLEITALSADGDEHTPARMYLCYLVVVLSSDII